MDRKLANKLNQIDSVSGDEKEISLALRTVYEGLSDDILYDNLGSIFAVKKSKQKNAQRVMVVGHMDEAGFIVKKVNENGTLVALGLGNIQKSGLLGMPVRLKKRNGEKICGTLVAYDETGNVLTKEKEVLVDLGFESSEAVHSSGIHLGDRIAFGQSYSVEEGQTRLFSKNWNGRYAPLLGIELLRELKEVELPFDLYVGCTVQEQVGFRGVQTATNLVSPDLGIILDTNQAFDYQLDVQERIGALGKGLLINFYDPTVLPNRLLLETLKTICKKHAISHQYYYSFEGSDAAWINKLRCGAPTLFVNVPVRNIDTVSSILDVRDYESAKAASLIFLKNLKPETIQAFKEENR